MILAKAFFDLQLAFAQKVTRLSGLPRSHVLLDYTNLYTRFGLGRDFERSRCGSTTDRHGAVNEHMTCRFLERLERQATMDGLDRCFSLPALSLDASVQHFYDLTASARL